MDLHANHEALCESPIEIALYRAMRALGMCPQPQVEIGEYRVDFLFGLLVIECDGHDFHASREQRTHDAKRDRALIMSGYQIARFTGTEIHHDSHQCAIDVLEMAHKISAELPHQPGRCGFPGCEGQTRRWPFNAYSTFCSQHEENYFVWEWPTRCRMPGCMRKTMSTLSECWSTCEQHSTEEEREIAGSTRIWEEITPLPAPPRQSHGGAR